MDGAPDAVELDTVFNVGAARSGPDVAVERVHPLQDFLRGQWVIGVTCGVRVQAITRKSQNLVVSAGV
jgi:hypothetical protein